jgi:hypothetical protein
LLANVTIITILLLGDSQIVGRTGQLLEKYYEDHGILVHREASSGKGVNYFLSATHQNNNTGEVLMFHVHRKRIRNFLKTGVDYIIIGALGGNDAYPGCCNTVTRRQRMTMKYRKLFRQLCSYNAIVVFNGSPRARLPKHRLFDTRRKMIDKIQKTAAIGTCVIFNSIRGMQIQPDQDGYHYNKSADLYVDFLMTRSGMRLPIIESGGHSEIR